MEEKAEVKRKRPKRSFKVQLRNREFVTRFSHPRRFDCEGVTSCIIHYEDPITAEITQAIGKAKVHPLDKNIATYEKGKRISYERAIGKIQSKMAKQIKFLKNHLDRKEMHISDGLTKRYESYERRGK